MKKRRGSVMILTIIVLSAVVAVLAGALATENAEFRGMASRIETIKAKNAAEAGVQYALATLQSQPTFPVNQNDEWFAFGDNANDSYLVGPASFRVQIVDAASLVNLNTAPQAQLESLGLTTEQIDSLLDWREEGQTPRPEGAKDEFYNTLEYPYNAKLARLDSLDELLMIKGFDPVTLLQNSTRNTTTTDGERPLYSLVTVDSFSPNSANGQQKQNINTATQAQIQGVGIPAQLAAAIVLTRNSQGPFTSMGQVLRVTGVNVQTATALIDRFTVGNQPRDEGKINLNTAPLDVLETLPEMTSDIADAVVSRQSAGIQSVGELFQAPGVTIQLMQSIVDYVSVSSEHFLVRVEGKSGSTRYALEAVIRVNGTEAKVVKFYEAPEQDMRELWGWQEDAGVEIELGAAAQ